MTWTRYSNIMPKGMFDKVNVLTQGIGTGPYKLTEFVPDDHAVLTRNADYWNKDAAGFIDEINLKVLADDQARVAGLARARSTSPRTCRPTWCARCATIPTCRC